jgi:hypothetical protein
MYYLNQSLKIDNIKKYLRIFRNFYWLRYCRFPIFKINILDFPIYSPLDCDLLEYHFTLKESKITINYAYKCLIKKFQTSNIFLILTSMIDNWYR